MKYNKIVSYLFVLPTHKFHLFLFFVPFGCIVMARVIPEQKIILCGEYGKFGESYQIIDIFVGKIKCAKRVVQAFNNVLIWDNL